MCVCVCVWCFFLSGFINQKLNHDSICCRFRPCGLNFMIGPIWSSAYSLGVEQMSESVIDRTLSDILSRPPCISVTFRGLRVSRALLIKLCVVLTRKHQRLEIYGLVQFTHYYSRTVDYWPEESVQYEQSHNHTWDQSYWFNISAISPRQIESKIVSTIKLSFVYISPKPFKEKHLRLSWYANRKSPKVWILEMLSGSVMTVVVVVVVVGDLSPSRLDIL